MGNRKYNDYHRINDQGVEEKQCKDCLRWFVMDENNFGSDKGNKDGFNMSCKICQKKYNQKSYIANRETRLADSKRRRLEKLPEITEYLTDYYKKNKETIKVSNQEYKNGHREYYRENSREYRHNEDNKDRLRGYNQTRKPKNHKMSDQEWIDCREYFKNEDGEYCCIYCGMTESKHKRRFKKGLHREHVIFDGRNDIKNCVPSCQICNRNKNHKTLNEFYNINNPNYTYQQYHKIYLWLRYDYKKFIQAKDIKVRNWLKKKKKVV